MSGRLPTRRDAANGIVRGQTKHEQENILLNRMETESFVETKFTRVTAHERRAFQTREGFVRYLGSFEHLHWLFSQTGPRAFAHAIEVTGTSTVEQWCAAVKALQQSQPFFSVQIDVDSNNRPYFRRVDGVPIPMRVLDATLSTSWEAELGKEVSTMVAANRAPLLRAVLIHESERSIFIMTAHHSISDGVSMREALCDLVRALSGQQLDRRSVLPSPEESLGLTSKGSTTHPPEYVAAKRINFVQNYVEPFSIHSLRFDATFTSRLRERARVKQTTLHGALCSAVIHAARMRLSSGKQETIRLLSAINAREQCGVSNTSSMCIGAAIIPVAAEPGLDLWSLARYLKAEHAGPTSRAGLTSALQMISDAVANMSDIESALDFIDPVFAYQVGISNIGEVPGTSRDSEVRLTSMWGPAWLLGCDGEQLIGAVTVNGRLHLLHTAYTPLPNLLEGTRAALISMCDEG